ncbi:hypothetical protein ACP70R_017548 [Stipagrostis hirtigluma subsp. patula]
MIPGSAVYHVVEAMVPLYTAAVLGYVSVRWLRAFSGEQCAGINHFVALYAVPVLIFHTISTNDPYSMNGRLVAADTLQKAIILAILMAWALWSHCYGRSSSGDDRKGVAATAPLKWVVTAFSVAVLPNTIVMGVPLLNGMYGAVSGGLMKQIVVMQFCVWYNLVIFLYEFMAARDGGSVKISPEPVAAAENRTGDEDEARESQNNELTEVAEATTAITMEDGSVCVAGVTSTTTESARVPSVMHVVWMAGKKVLHNPNTYASFLGLIWSLIAFKFGIKMPKIIEDSLFVVYTTAVGLSMFSSGTFIARQSRIVPCGYAIASLSMLLKFLVGPVVMLLGSLTIGLHGTLLHIAVVQAALPLAVTSFVYAEEYKVKADIMSTGVILGIFISLPVTIVYYILLGL